MAGFFALNREATSPSEQAMFWGASWCGLMLTVVYAGLMWVAAEAAGSVGITWHALVVPSLLVVLLLGIVRYRRDGSWKHVLMQCLVALYSALAALSAVGVVGLRAPQLLVVGSALLLLFLLLPFVLPHSAAS